MYVNKCNVNKIIFVFYYSGYKKIVNSFDYRLTLHFISPKNITITHTIIINCQIIRLLFHITLYFTITY